MIMDNKTYTEEDYYNEFVKDYDDKIKENIHYNKLVFEKLWSLAESGLPIIKVLNFFPIDEDDLDEDSKETYERFIKYWESEFNED